MEALDLCSPAELIALSNELIRAPFKHGYHDISSDYRKQAEIAKEEGKTSLANGLELLSAALSMMLVPHSRSEPFKPYIQLEGKRSAIAEDFSIVELGFIDRIYQDLQEPLVRARLAELLWLRINPKNIEHARSAIAAYLQLPIDFETWHADIGSCWERAILLAQVIRDSTSIKMIEERLFEAFQSEHLDSPYMKLWIAELMDKKGICTQSYNDISDVLLSEAQALHKREAYRDAREYLSLAEKRFNAANREMERLTSLVLIAHCFELEGDRRSGDDTPSQMVANSIYENALQAFRRVPTRHRDSYGVTDKLISIRNKISDAGVASLDEMGLIQSPGVDISDMVSEAKTHVSGKDNLELAFLYFTGFAISNYQSMRTSAIANIQNSPISNMFGATHMSSDGRVIAKTEGLSLSGDISDNEESVFNKVVRDLQFHQQLQVNGQIVPALNQILSEFRVTRDHLSSLCYHSPVVPEGREHLMATALWLGFEHDFGTCVHLLSPQVEHMIRVALKKQGVQTSNIDKFGIETENGLNTLLGLPSAQEILGEDTLFELKALFTTPVGPNLRNEVAHGLLDDGTADSIPSVYAWWFILRMIVRAIYESDSNSQEV